MSQDKRTLQRAEVNLPAVYVIVGKDTLSVDVTVLNISPQGMCFRSQHEVREHEKIQISVDVAPGEQVLIHAKAVWTKADQPGQHLIGVQIEDPIAKNFDKFLDCYSEMTRPLPDAAPAQ